MAALAPEPGLVARFRRDLEALASEPERLGLAVSGGPDSLALLLLAAASRPDDIEAATVDHGLRTESRAEADMVGELCERLGVPHTALVIEWDEPPASAIQEQARQLRYAALAAWMREDELGALATAHHLDDQAETLLMRLNRGSGVRGLGGMRPASIVLDCPDLKLLRPLLGWRRGELEHVCAAAGVQPVTDPSNADHRFERVRIRKALATSDWLNPEALARSASNLAAADEALDWAAAKEWAEYVDVRADEIVYRTSTAAAEIVRRVVGRAVSELATEGDGEEPRGREIDRLLGELGAGRTATLRGVQCSGGADWRFTQAPPRGR